MACVMPYPQYLIDSSKGLTDEDYAMIDECYQWLDEQSEENEFLNESHRLCAPEFDDVGCFIHQNGEAKIWDHDNCLYVPITTNMNRHGAWPHPHHIFAPPVLTNSDLPERYISCDISDCENLTECYMSPDCSIVSESSDNQIVEDVSDDEECLGCESGADCSDAHDHNCTLNEDYMHDYEEDEEDVPDDGLDLVRTSGFCESSLRLELIPEVNWGNSECDRNSPKKDLIRSFTPSPPPPTTWPMQSEEKKRKSEKGAIVSFIKEDNTGKHMFYILQFSNGENCYAPSHLMENTLKLTDTVDVLAFPMEGHKNQWRAYKIRVPLTKTSFKIMCEDTKGNWGFLIGHRGSTLKELARTSTKSNKKPPSIILKPMEDGMGTEVTFRNSTEHTDMEFMKEQIIALGEKFGYNIDIE